MRKLLVKGGRLIGPGQGQDEIRDLWIVGSKISSARFPEAEADETIDATGMLIMPGFVDPHVHLREPGNEEAETIATGCAAALAGGYTAVGTMPNTTPCTDAPETVERVFRAVSACTAPMLRVVAALTAGRSGRELANLEAFANDLHTRVTGFTDDGSGVQDESLARRAMEFCARHDVPYIEHCEVADLSAGGVVHPCAEADRRGLKGYPAEAEWRMIERDLRLAEETGAHVHFQHLSSARSVELIAEAKARGRAAVTAEVTPHHLTLTVEDALAGGTNFKMNPPLRAKEDRQALLAGLKDGVIDMIATDHAPHTAESKALPFAEAPNGVIGLETAAAVAWTNFVEPGILTRNEMARRMSIAPARFLRVPATETFEDGDAANLVVFDPNARWTVDAAAFKSKSRNCPFDGWAVRGRVTATVVEGEVRYRADIH